MAVRTYALVGRDGDDGDRYFNSEWPRMKARAWEMYQAGHLVQVWRAMHNAPFDLISYDGEATRRISDHIVKQRLELEKASCVITATK